MRMAFGAWLAFLAVAAGGAGRASADPFVLADPRVDPSWGRQLGRPTAPSRTVEADAELPAVLTGQARTIRYVDELLASATDLDSAAAFHFYSAPSSIRPPPSRPQLPLEAGPRALADAAAIARKAEEAEPLLAGELDKRFDALTAAVERADAFVLNEQPGAARVTYCRWIGEAAGLLSGPLGEHLWAHCIDRRDAFLAVLIRCMADLAAIPDIGAPGASVVDDRQLSGGLHLSEGVLPGEVRAPLAYASLEAAFQQRLGARFDAAEPRLQATLSDAMARRAATDVLLPPADDCRAMLGRYAGPLADLPAARAVAGNLGRSCMATVQQRLPAALDRIAGSTMAELGKRAAMARDGDLDAARIVETPEATCAGLLAPHFPAGSEAYRTAAFRSARLEELRLGCLAQARRTHDAIIERHLATAIAASRPEDDTGAAWEARGWFATPPGGSAWIDGRVDPGGLAAFTNRYEAAMQPPRKEAAARLAAAVERSFAVKTGVEPQGATRACAASYQATADDLLTIALGGGAPDARPPPNDAFRARPELTAPEAAAWIRMTCRDLQARTLAARRGLAQAAGHVADVFKDGLKLAVLSPAGEWVPVDPAKLVASAATDMIQVAFLPGGTFASARMTITPFGRSSPSLSGKLIEATRPGDQKTFLRLDGLQGFPELDGPLETVACAAMQDDHARRRGRQRIFAAGMAAFFGNSFILAGAVEDAARRDLLDVEACAAAKRAFTGMGASQ